MESTTAKCPSLESFVPASAIGRPGGALVSPGALFGVVRPTRSMSVTSRAVILMDTIVKILSYREHCLGVDSAPDYVQTTIQGSRRSEP